MTKGPKGTIVMIGLGKPKTGASSMPPRLGAGRPTKKAPGPPHIGGPAGNAAVDPVEPDADDMVGGHSSASPTSFRCPNCGAPLNVGHDGGNDPGPTAA